MVSSKGATGSKLGVDGVIGAAFATINPENIIASEVSRGVCAPNIKAEAAIREPAEVLVDVGTSEEVGETVMVGIFVMVIVEVEVIVASELEVGGELTGAKLGIAVPL